MAMKELVAILILVCTAVPCTARTVRVDSAGLANYRSIQEALDHCSNGDVIVVKPGTYEEGLVFQGRAVTVRSEDPDDPGVVQGTVITCRTAPAVAFSLGEGNLSVLEGFTITGQGITCIGASPTISRNVIRNCEGSGITGRNAAPIITGNTIVANRLEGVFACDGLIQGNTISQNTAGAVYCNGPIRDNVITGNGPGGGLYYCNGPIVGNVISANRSDSMGGGLSNCAGDILNNIIAGNQARRQGGGLYNCTKAVVNNTVVGNTAGDQGGGLHQCSGIVRNNIIGFNTALLGGGIYGAGSNTYNAFWANGGGDLAAGPAYGVGDVLVNPRFARDGRWDGNGTQDTGDDFWIDGDYHLKSQAGRWDPAEGRWVADEVTSQCIDAGDPSSDWWAELWPHGQRINMGAYGGTAQASMSPAQLGHLGDLNHDARVGPADLKRMGLKWPLQQDLLAEDLNLDGRVDLKDLVILGAHWRSGRAVASAPVPDPMTWAVKPHATGPYSIAMVATTATSTDASGVEYYFQDAFHPQYNSGWLSFPPGEPPRWEDTELSPLSSYWYRVKARNKGNRVETRWSEQVGAQTGPEDWTAPTPNPLTWEIEPHGIAAGAIRMVATQASDDSGVEYRFECISHPAYGSNWQDSRTYQTGSLPRGYYMFAAQARDKSRNHNTTAPTKIVTVDMLPPTPDPMQWEIEPREINIGGGTFDYCATMKAVEASDDATEVEYYFQCTTESGFSSGWQTSREYTVKVGRRNQYHRFRVKARDLSPSRSETAYSSEVVSK